MRAAAAPKAAKRWLPEWISTDVLKVYFFARLRRIIATRERRNPRRPGRIYSRARVPSCRGRIERDFTERGVFHWRQRAARSRNRTQRVRAINSSGVSQKPRRFEKLRLTRFDQGREAERFEVGIGEPHREGAKAAVAISIERPRNGPTVSIASTSFCDTIVAKLSPDSMMC
jgi:hypothetical protein